jgi:hypothetical protein
MKSTRNLSLLKRLLRLEAVQQKKAETSGREAFIVMGGHEGETHLEMTSSPDAVSCWFQQRPGPGPQLSDFGQFAFVLHLTQAEANA